MSSEFVESSAPTINSNNVQISSNTQLTIKPSDAKTLLETENSAFLIDVRPLFSYEIGHITGAVSIPIEELENRRGEIPKDRQIVVYAQCH
jgi:rhodanese-related sulfurtransferase